MAKPFAPELRTAIEDHNGGEKVKRESDGMRGTLHEEFRDSETPDITGAAETLAKSYGIYLEFNRAKTGKEKDWMYMIRLGIPGGGPISPEQWTVVDELAEEYGRNPQGYGSIRLTTRAAIQFHWVKKEGVIPIIKRSAEVGLLSLNGCGDNVRNVMACPLSHQSALFNGQELSREIASYFQLPATPFVQIFALDPAALEQDYDRFQYGPQLLNRKFKIAIGALYRDDFTDQVLPENCAEIRAHDLGIQPLWENGAVNRYQLYVGGGQGEKYGKASASVLAEPLGIASAKDLMAALDAIVAVHQEWGDRKNRHWARLKYVIKLQGVAWYRDQVQQRLGFQLEDPIEGLDTGPRHLHHGWHKSDFDNTYSFGAFIENGRLMDGGLNGALKTMVREVVAKYRTPLHLTANQDIIFSGIDEDLRESFEADLASYGFGKRNGASYSNLRLQSGACVGRDTCRLAYTDSEKYLPLLIDDLEALGWGNMIESIGITGCERQCFRPGTKTIGLVGSGLNRYQLKLGGDVDARHQGEPLRDGDRIYLRSVPRDRVPGLLDTLFNYYFAHREEGEDLGAFHRRVGHVRLIKYLGVHPKTADLMIKSAAYDGLPDDLETSHTTPSLPVEVR